MPNLSRTERLEIAFGLFKRANRAEDFHRFQQLYGTTSRASAAAGSPPLWHSVRPDNAQKFMNSGLKVLPRIMAMPDSVEDINGLQAGKRPGVNAGTGPLMRPGKSYALPQLRQFLRGRAFDWKGYLGSSLAEDSFGADDARRLYSNWAATAKNNGGVPGRVRAGAHGINPWEFIKNWFPRRVDNATFSAPVAVSYAPHAPERQYGAIHALMDPKRTVGLHTKELQFGNLREVAGLPMFNRQGTKLYMPQGVTKGMLYEPQKIVAQLGKEKGIGINRQLKALGAIPLSGKILKVLSRLR